MAKTGTIGKIRCAFGSLRNERHSAAMSTMNLVTLTEQPHGFQNGGIWEVHEKMYLLPVIRLKTCSSERDHQWMR